MAHPKTLVSISGKARRGKTALAKQLERHDGYVRMSWADALREEVQQPHNIVVEYDVQNDLTEVQIDEVTIHDKELAISILYWMSESPGVSDQIEYTRHGEDDSIIRYVIYRHRMKDKDPLLLQWWGTDYRRTHCGQDYWIDKLMDRVTTALLSGTSVVIDDTRFHNEIEAVRGCAEADLSLSVRMERNHPIEETGRDDAHKSEVLLDDFDDWDLVINNDGSLEELYPNFKALSGMAEKQHVVHKA